MMDFRSDTLTQPTKEMLAAMMNAVVGDDIYGEDPTINLLEKTVCEMFQMEAALFCPSGTMANQIAINVHTLPGDEVICHKYSHIYNYEGGGMAFNSGVNVRLTYGNRGIVTPDDCEGYFHDGSDVHPAPIGLVSMENTVNKSGGTTYSLDEIEDLSKWTKKKNLPLHMDGARFFNAALVQGYSTKEIGKFVDSISICLSKGLGCPVGSLLVGSEAFIKKARRIRKRFGGGWRQAGYLAAAGLYALENHIEKLIEDHHQAAAIYDILKELDYVHEVQKPETNILLFSLVHPTKVEDFISYCKKEEILLGTMGTNTLRIVTHQDTRKISLTKLKTKLKAYK